MRRHGAGKPWWNGGSGSSSCCCLRGLGNHGVLWSRKNSRDVGNDSIGLERYYSVISIIL